VHSLFEPRVEMPAFRAPPSNPVVIVQGKSLLVFENPNQRFSVGRAVIGERDSESKLASQPCECDPRFVSGRQGREELVNAIRGERGKDPDRSAASSVAPVCRGMTVAVRPPRGTIRSVSAVRMPVRLLAPLLGDLGACSSPSRVSLT